MQNNRQSQTCRAISTHRAHGARMRTLAVRADDDPQEFRQ